MYRIGLPSSVGQPFSAPFFWALLGPNSCARHLGAFCFSVSSQEIFGNPTEDFSCPSRNAVPRSGSSGLSLLGAPEKWSRKRRHFHVLLELGNDRRICWGRPGAASQFTVLSVATQRSWKNTEDEWVSKVEWHRVAIIWN